jgi:hypothetical protein
MGMLKNLWSRLRARRQPRRNGYGPDVLCAGWVDLPAALRAPRTAAPRGRAPAGG